MKTIHIALIACAVGDTDLVRLKDVIIPEVFTRYIDIYTKEKSELIRSGIVSNSAQLSALLAGGGATFNMPFFKDLDRDDEENISKDTGPDSGVSGISTGAEVQVRLSRNKTWGSADLTGDLIGTDPLNHIIAKIGGYWLGRQQRLFIATAKGVFAGNAKPTDASHKQNDLTFDASGSEFADGVTTFTASNFVSALGTMGDAMSDLKGMAVHSIVYQRMIKNNLIDFIPDSQGTTMIPTYMGRYVIVDDQVPFDPTGKFETWLFGAGAFAWGSGSAKVPVEVERKAQANNGGGEERITHRVEWVLHPVGHAYKGAAVTGGPSNAATAGNLAHEDTFVRVFNERKQIPLARLITREF